MTIIDLIRERAAEFADNPAVIERDLDGNRSWTHAQLWNRVDRLSQALLSLDLEKGDVLMAWLGNVHEAVECELAALQCGFVWVTLNKRVSPGEVMGVVRTCAPRAFVTDVEGLALLDRTNEALRDVEFLIVGEDVASVVVREPLPAQGYEETLAAGESARPQIDIQPADIARLRYTSGTTGSAKAAVLPHRVYLASLKNLEHELHPMDAADRVLHAAPLTHASGAMMFPALAAGGANVLMHRFDAEAVLETIERERITAMFVVPTMIHRLIVSPKFKDADLSSLRSVMYGGAPTPPEDLEPLIAKIGPALIHIFGMTEAPYPICTLGREEHYAGNPRLGCIGKPTTVCEVKLVHDDGKEVASGDVGEIWIRGENVMEGYWKDDEATREVMRDGWLASGDLAVRDADGFIRIVDRKKDVIISGGFNVYPAELEATLAELPGVGEVAVVGQPDPEWGERVVAYLTARPGEIVDVQEIDAWCRRELAGYKRPRKFCVLDELPKNPSGKVLKKELAKRGKMEE